LLQVGADTVVSYAQRMGLKRHLDAVPSLAIGSCEVMPMELVSAYSIFPNHGNRAEPYYIESIVDKSGNVLEEHTPVTHAVLSPQTSFVMCDVLTGVVRRGTGAAIPGLGFSRPSAGKTGTSNDYSDAWFVGFTPQIACVVWVGMDERRSLGYGVTGALGAVPLYAKAMIALHRKVPVQNFVKPDSVYTMKFCSVSHKLACPSCPQPFDEYVIAGHMPDSCDLHGANRVRQQDKMDMFGTKSAPENKVSTKKRVMF
jgi:penicillin-binding protein 1A